MIVKLWNIGLRLASLALKLGLTLYMGKYLGLAELGTFGLVSAATAIFIPLAGMRLDYFVMRELVVSSEVEIASKMRDETVFYLLNYLVLIVVFSAAVLPFGLIDKTIFIYTILLCCLESLATIITTNLISLGRQVMATFLFFVRSALWVIPAVALGLIDEQYRTAGTVFNLWLAGVVISHVMTFYVIRNLPWKETFKIPVNWVWIRRAVSSGLFIWIGSVAVVGAGYIDRFVLELNLTREDVGVASFYGSFTLAIAALLNSGVFAFTYPKLIALHSKSQSDEFKTVTKKMFWNTALVSGGLGAIMGIVIPYLGVLFDRPEFAQNAWVFWLLLIGTWFKSIAEGYYQVLFARHQDKAIWLGNLIFLVIACVANAILIPLTGLAGIGYSAIISSVFLGVWRYYAMRFYKDDFARGAAA